MLSLIKLKYIINLNLFKFIFKIEIFFFSFKNQFIINLFSANNDKYMKLLIEKLYIDVRRASIKTLKKLLPNMMFFQKYPIRF